MGTNYYLKQDACASCGRGGEDLHIGKSSAGWCFSLNTHPELGIRSLAAWQRVWRDQPIYNEYGDKVTKAKMLRVIKNRKTHNSTDRSPQFLESIYAAEGPNGLLRHKVDGRFCLANGSGTWDIMRGEFS